MTISNHDHNRSLQRLARQRAAENHTSYQTELAALQRKPRGFVWDREKHPLLHIVDGPGTGKSTFARALADEVRRDGGVAAFFYPSATVESWQHTLKRLREHTATGGEACVVVEDVEVLGVAATTGLRQMIDAPGQIRWIIISERAFDSRAAFGRAFTTVGVSAPPAHDKPLLTWGHNPHERTLRPYGPAGLEKTSDFRHLGLYGPAGSGKTTALRHLARQGVAANSDVVVIGDGHERSGWAKGVNFIDWADQESVDGMLNGLWNRMREEVASPVPSPFPTLVLLDDYHPSRLHPSTSAHSPEVEAHLAHLFTSGRAFGIFLALASQSPAHVPVGVRYNTQPLVFGRMPSAAMASLRLDESMPELQRGECWDGEHIYNVPAPSPDRG